MSIVSKEGFLFYDDQCIIVEGEKLQTYIAFIKKNKIKDIALSNSYYYECNIDFLEEIPFIESLNITCSSIKDFSGLKNLSALKSLTIEEPKSKVDLSFNPQLRELSVDMNKNIVGTADLKKLKILRVWKYNPTCKNLCELNSLSSVEELYITQSTITSLKGCGEFRELKKLELSYLSKLEYIDEIELNSSTLKHLRFDACKKIKNHDYVSKLQNLELLAFDESSPIPTISFIRHLPKLKSFIFVGTNVLDGDLSACIGLDYVGFLNKRHYSHKFEDLNKK